jgi:isoleucyl-tRNA synthetase
VDLYCGTELYQQLQRLEDELRFVTITSYARVHRETERDGMGMHHTLTSGDELWITVAPSEYQKCIRCWHHREDVGLVAEQPNICARCLANVEGEGEVRRYA